MLHMLCKHFLYMSRKSRGPLLGLATAALLALSLPAAAAAGPAVDEYTLEIPGPKGPKNVKPGGSNSNPGSLPPGVRDELGGGSGGSSGSDGSGGAALDDLLVQAATASELGAPTRGAGGAAGKGSGDATKQGSDGSGNGDGASGPPGSSAPESAAEAGSGSLFGVASDEVLGGASPLVIGLGLVTIAIAAVALFRRQRSGNTGS